MEMGSFTDQQPLLLHSTQHYAAIGGPQLARNVEVFHKAIISMQMSCLFGVPSAESVRKVRMILELNSAQPQCSFWVFSNKCGLAGDNSPKIVVGLALKQVEGYRCVQTIPPRVGTYPETEHKGLKFSFTTVALASSFGYSYVD